MNKTYHVFWLFYANCADKMRTVQAPNILTAILRGCVYNPFLESEGGERLQFIVLEDGRLVLNNEPLPNSQEGLAELLFTNYDMGDVEVASVNGWENDGQGTLSRSVFLENLVEPDAPSIQYKFAVRFADNDKPSFLVANFPGKDAITFEPVDARLSVKPL